MKLALILTMDEIYLDNGIKLPEEIEFSELDNFLCSPDNSEDDTLLFNFDGEQANRERERINNTIKDLQLHGLWL